VVRASAASPVILLHVDARSGAADDRNPGTEARPLRTIGRGVALAAVDNARGAAVTLLIHPGVYRESISIPPGGTPAPLTLEATERGAAIVTGSDLWKGWRPVGTEGTYAHAWPYAWGLAPVPEHWPRLHDIVRRREMVFVGGVLGRQVLSPAALAPGTFYVDDARGTILIRPPAGVDPNRGGVEVAVRDPLLEAVGRATLTLRGLVFEHAATPLDASAVRVDAMRDFVVEDTVFRWNNWGGLSVTASARVTVRRSRADHNGARGMSTWKNRDLLYEDDDTSYNNWRGAWGSFYGWSAAGSKNMLLHRAVFRRHTSVGNATYGFWLDTDNRDITVDGARWCGNTDGAFVEASQGPITLAHTVICGNAGAGLLVSMSGHVAVRDSVLYQNGADAQFTTNDIPSGTIRDWETGETVALRTADWTLCGDAFVAAKPEQRLLSLPSWDFFRRSLRADQNVYWNPRQPEAFWVRRAIAGRAFDLEGWRRAWGQDRASVFADPGFTDPARGDFTPQPSSPWHPCR
jgi:hypothetical protein